jgi:hypothetical protein
MTKFRLSLCLAACLVFPLACLESEDATDDTGSAGTSGNQTGGAGTSAAAGTTGAAGTNGAAGTSAAAGTNGAAGTSAAAGSNGAAGTSAAAGSNGAAGTKGAAGTTGAAGTSGAAGTQGNVTPTFTMIYNQILGPTPTVIASSCGGGTCHLAPGGGKGLEHINMTTKALAYTGVKKFVVVGNPNGSKFFTEVNTGAMPEGRPKLPANLIKMISDWIMAGALDN